jgi:hypothetical protein
MPASAVIPNANSAVNFNQSAAMTQLANREQRQDARIQQGIQSGQLTPQEATRLQSRELRIDARIAKQEAQPGGLTAQQFMKDTFSQDTASLSIWFHKHNGSHVQSPPSPTNDPTQSSSGTGGVGGTQGLDPAAALNQMQEMVDEIRQLMVQLNASANV